MDVSVSADEFVDAFRRDFPAQYEITALRLLNGAQAKRIAELEAQRPQVREELAAALEPAPANPGHTQPCE